MTVIKNVVVKPMQNRNLRKKKKKRTRRSHLGNLEFLLHQRLGLTKEKGKDPQLFDEKKKRRRKKKKKRKKKMNQEKTRKMKMTIVNGSLRM